MKYILLILFSFLNSFVISQALLSQWSFENVTSTNTGSSATISTTIANGGVLTTGSEVSALHASSSTVWSNPAGNGSVKSIGANNWSVGDYFQFKFSTAGYSSLIINWEQFGSATGPRDFKVQYSTASTYPTFTDVTGSNYTIASTPAFSSTTYSSVHSKSLNLSSITALDNQSIVYIRLVDNSTTAINGTTVASAGTGRVDSFRVLGYCTNQTLVVTTSTGITEQCNDGWSYYGATTNDRFFGIKKNGNVISPTVDITVGSTISKTASNGVNQEHGMFLMGRYWNVNCPGCTITTPVDIRFFYDPAELNSAKTARDAALPSTPSLAVSSGNTAEWFKNTNNAPFDASYISAIVGNTFPSTYMKFSSPTISTLNGVTYVELTGITSFSGGTGGFSYGPANGSGSNALPVTWASLEVQPSASENLIQWSTASEKNASYFVVEHSKDGKTFSPASNAIAAIGNSVVVNNYSYVHTNSSPISYYRIKQIDVEGYFSFSKIVVANKSSLTKNPIQVYSSDNYQTIQLSYTNSNESMVDIAILDLMGKTVASVKNNASIETIDIRHLNSGVYFVRLTVGNTTTTHKFSKP